MPSKKSLKVSFVTSGTQKVEVFLFLPFFYSNIFLTVVYVVRCAKKKRKKLFHLLSLHINLIVLLKWSANFLHEPTELEKLNTKKLITTIKNVFCFTSFFLSFIRPSRREASTTGLEKKTLFVCLSWSKFE